MTWGIIVMTMSSCSMSGGAAPSPDAARDALVTTIEDSAVLIDVPGWEWTGAPEVGNCGARRGARANWTYVYGAPPPSGRDYAADARTIADHWTSLGVKVRLVDSPSYVVYASGGPVAGLSFSTAPGNYFIAGTSLCVPSDLEEIRRQQKG